MFRYYYYYCADRTAKRPVTDTALRHNEINNQNRNTWKIIKRDKKQYEQQNKYE